jgi:hypothetical protein
MSTRLGLLLMPEAFMGIPQNSAYLGYPRRSVWLPTQRGEWQPLGVGLFYA